MGGEAYSKEEKSTGGGQTTLYGVIKERTDTK